MDSPVPFVGELGEEETVVWTAGFPGSCSSLGPEACAVVSVPPPGGSWVLPVFSAPEVVAWAWSAGWCWRTTGTAATGYQAISGGGEVDGSPPPDSSLGISTGQHRRLFRWMVLVG